ncbi:hypothetical protein KM043_017168 [Ampulex compressa]|nr:hypothetical protein KM043_017168 [Ampulex compressa]
MSDRRKNRRRKRLRMVPTKYDLRRLIPISSRGTWIRAAAPAQIARRTNPGGYAHGGVTSAGRSRRISLTIGAPKNCRSEEVPVQRQQAARTAAKYSVKCACHRKRWVLMEWLHCGEKRGVSSAY